MTVLDFPANPRSLPADARNAWSRLGVHMTPELRDLLRQAFHQINAEYRGGPDGAAEEAMDDLARLVRSASWALLDDETARKRWRCHRRVMGMIDADARSGLPLPPPFDRGEGA